MNLNYLFPWQSNLPHREFRRRDTLEDLDTPSGNFLLHQKGMMRMKQADLVQQQESGIYLPFLLDRLAFSAQVNPVTRFHPLETVHSILLTLLELGVCLSVVLSEMLVV